MIILPLLIGIYTTQAQSIQRSVIGSAGKVSTSGNYKLSYSVGETITKKISTTGLSINQGFQQGIVTNTPLPITGLQFSARRINSAQVHIEWKTQTEINNKGFSIERKLENEQDYKALAFQPSLAQHGHSELELRYTYQDNNSYSGKSYYRLKQEDHDGKFSYSIIRVVNGDASTWVTMNVWPVPAKEYINVSVAGIQKSEQVFLLDMNGKVIKKYTVLDQQDQRIELTGLASGIYFVKLNGENGLVQKVTVE